MNAFENYDVLGQALAKDEAGRGITATEGRMIRNFEQGKIGRNHFDKIPNLPVSIPSGANNSTISRDRVETTNIQIDSETVNLEKRVKVLEALLSGFARRSISVCDGGITKTMTIASTTPA